MSVPVRAVAGQNKRLNARCMHTKPTQFWTVPPDPHKLVGPIMPLAHPTAPTTGDKLIMRSRWGASTSRLPHNAPDDTGSNRQHAGSARGGWANARCRLHGHLLPIRQP